MSIQLQGVTKTFGTQIAVNNISFEAKKGHVLGFLGPNGAGKSTTMKMIAGYLKADSGQITVSGHSVSNNLIQVRQKIGYLPESNALYYDMYVREYLRFTASTYKISNPSQAAENAIVAVGLTPESGKKIGQLSKGYKQRVGLAAAIIHNPEVLILDEPTSGLDPNQIVEIRQLIKDLGKEKTVLLSTHIMQEVEAICDQVIILNKGKIVANDSLHRLVANANNNEAVRVSFEEALEPAWLQRLPGVIKVDKISALQWDVYGADTQLVRKELLQLAQEQSLNISSIQKSGGSLEEIFRNLTQKL